MSNKENFQKLYVNYNEKQKIYDDSKKEIEIFFKKKLSRFYGIGRSVLRKSYGRNLFTEQDLPKPYHSFNRHNDLSWLLISRMWDLVITDIDSTTLTLKGKDYYKNSVVKEFKIKIEDLFVSDRDFAKRVRKAVAEVKAAKKQKQMENLNESIKTAEKTIEEAQRELKLLQKLLKDTNQKEQLKA